MRHLLPTRSMRRAPTSGRLNRSLSLYFHLSLSRMSQRMEKESAPNHQIRQNCCKASHNIRSAPISLSQHLTGLFSDCCDHPAKTNETFQPAFEFTREQAEQHNPEPRVFVHLENSPLEQMFWVNRSAMWLHRSAGRWGQSNLA